MLRKFFLIVSLFLIFLSLSFSQVGFKGYLDNRLFISDQDKGFSQIFPKEQYSLSGWNRARITAETDISRNGYVNLTVDYFNYFGEMARMYRFINEQQLSNAPYQEVKLDRAYFQLSREKTQLIVGMQRISLGKSFVWSPFDVFNRVNMLEPQEEKRGVNAVKFTYYPSNLSRIMLIASPSETLSESRLGFITDFNYKNTDFQLGIIHDFDGFRKRYIAGFNLKGEIEVGYWIETAFISQENYLPGILAQLEEDKKWYTNFILGIDYTFDIGNGLYVMTEYFNDNSGATDPADYNYLLLFTRRKPMLARDYLLFMAQYNLSMISSLSLSGIRNMVDDGMILIPGYNYEIMQDVSLMAGMYIFLGQEGDEYKPPEDLLPENIQSLLPINLNRNFQAYIWLKVNF